jgi:hypothetical protein
VIEGWNALPSAKPPASPGSMPRGAACRYRSAVRGARTEWPASAFEPPPSPYHLHPVDSWADQPDGGRPRGFAYGMGELVHVPGASRAFPGLRSGGALPSRFHDTRLRPRGGPTRPNKAAPLPASGPCWRRHRLVNTNLKGWSTTNEQPW